MNEAGATIAAMEARDKCKGEPDIMKRIEKAMKACRGHWMETSPSGQLRAAIAAAMLESEGAERERIERSVAALNRANAAFQAMQAGVDIDIESAFKADEDTIPLAKMWRGIATA